MTPQLKAKEIMKKYGTMLSFDHNFRSITVIRKCALIAVDEILLELENLHDPEYAYFYPEEQDVKEGMDGEARILFYKNVRKEIENL